MKLEGRENFQRQFNVSRETMEKLDIFVRLLEKWNPHINLVSKTSLGQVWMRHIADSAQLFEIGGLEAGSWTDFGSGGGFPGIVLSILSSANGKNTRFTLVESDVRKASFLKTVLRDVEISANVISDRIETIPPLAQDRVSARALAPLSRLLSYAARHLKVDGKAVFPKGAHADQELETALASWRFEVEKFPSKSDPSGVILRLGAIEHV